MKVIPLLFFAGFLGLHLSCGEQSQTHYWKPVTVTVSAFNSVPWQTDSLHNLAAWGDTLKPGMKAIAVSRDLIEKGLDYNTPVKIEGLEGIFLVKDKMHYRWRNRIDIYMGSDVRRARAWGRKKLEIRFPALRDTLMKNEE